MRLGWITATPLGIALREIHEWELAPDEREGMEAAAKTVREAADSITA